MNALNLTLGAIGMLSIAGAFFWFNRKPSRSRYLLDEGPLSAEYLAWLQQHAKQRLPAGRILSRISLF